MGLVSEAGRACGPVSSVDGADAGSACRVVRVSDLSDSRLDVYARLTEREIRSVLEPEKGIFIAESAKVIERAVEAGLQPVSFLMAERWLPVLAPLLRRLGGDGGAAAPGDGAGVGAGTDAVPVFVAPEDLMRQLTGYEVTRGALAAFRRPVLPDALAFLRGIVDAAGDRPVRVCVLEGIVDHTNVGAIFRSAAALNVDGVLVSPTCCDPLYRRAVRVSMGTVFQVPWCRIGADARHWPDDGLAVLHEAGFACAAMALSDDSISLDDPALGDHGRLAIFMGTEGAGLGARTIRGCDACVRIPMAHGVDSLNVAAASAVAFWQLCPHGSNDYRYRPGLYS